MSPSAKKWPHTQNGRKFGGVNNGNGYKISGITLYCALEQVYLSSGHAPWVLSNEVSSVIIQMATGLREYLIKAGAITTS
jgi:hypothetical protein